MTRLIILITVLMAFTGWSTGIILEEGYLGFLMNARDDAWGRQVLVDLVLTLGVAWAYLHQDARRVGIPWVPYFLVSIPLGVIGPLAYLIHREVVTLRRKET